MSDRPRSGARFLLELAPGDGGRGARATYRAAIFTPDASYEGRAVLVDDGAVELAIEGAPDELAAALRTFAVLVARGVAKKRADGLPPWPGRVLRWRPA